MPTQNRAARSDTVGLIVNTLFTLAKEAAAQTQPENPKAASLAGHRFEDDAVKAAYQSLVRVGITPQKPRHTLHLPTLSDLPQQFDLVVTEHTHCYIVELKRRSHSEIEQLYAFIAKLLDYSLAAKRSGTDMHFKGIFVSTASQLNDHFRQYAIAYGVIPIAPDLPPCEVIRDCSSDAGLAQDAAKIAKRLEISLPEAVLLPGAREHTVILRDEWKSIAQRWKQHNERNRTA